MVGQLLPGAPKPTSSPARELPELCPGGRTLLLDCVSWGDGKGEAGWRRVVEGGGSRRHGQWAWACAGAGAASVRVRALRFTDCASSTRSPRSRI